MTMKLVARVFLLVLAFAPQTLLWAQQPVENRVQEPVGKRAQQPAENFSPYYTMERIRSKSGWLESDNPAGLIRNEVSFSTAEIGFDGSRGDLRNVADGTRQSVTGIRSESYRREGRLSFYGALGYRYESALDRSWAGNTDLYTSSMAMGDSIPGNTRGENYYLGAGVAYRLGRWSLGVGGRYEDRSLAKRRDPRNKTTYMNLDVSSGATFSSRPLDAGVSFTYGRTTEQVAYRTFGTNENLLSVYLFEGLWFYVQEALNNELAGQADYQGSRYRGALQAEWRVGRSVSFFSQVSSEYASMQRYRPRGDMRLGDQQSLSYRYLGMLTHTGARADHRIRVDASFGEWLKYNNIQELELDPETNYNGYTQYGRFLKFTQSQRRVDVSYKLYLKRDAWNSSWIVEASYAYFGRESGYRISPARYDQRLYDSRVRLGVTKNLILGRRGFLDVTLRAGRTFGGGVPLEKRCPDGVQIEPENYRADLLAWEFHFLTGDRIQGELGLRYTHRLRRRNLALYVDLQGGCEQALSGQFDGRSRTRFSTAAGLNF